MRLRESLRSHQQPAAEEPRQELRLLAARVPCIGRRAANVRVPVAVPITYPIPPNTDPVMARRYQWRWERVEREIESELRLGRQHKEPKCKFTDNNGKKIVPIDLIELAERKGRQAIPSRILPITEVPSSNRLGSSVADRVRIVTTEEFERL